MCYKYIIFNILLLCKWISSKDLNILTLSGQILGTEAKSFNGNVFYSFRGIPFAEPPVGNLRFEAPVEIDCWSGVKDVRNKDVICFNTEKKLNPSETEDCLTINIYTPSIPSDKENVFLPVMVWFHGGGFVRGNAAYNNTGPEFLMDYGVVVVTINHRLAAFGFLSTEDLVMPGNNGLRDQRLGLKWVHRNIQKFGGDPSTITLVGLSAGAKTNGFLMLDKNSFGLFRAAIFESGTPILAGTLAPNSREIAYQTANFINSSITINNTSSEELLRFLKSASALDIKMATHKVFILNGGPNYSILNGFTYSPVMETKHDNAFITKKMYEEFKSGNFYKIPIIIGTTSEEMLEHSIANKTQFSSFLKSWDEMPETLVPHSMNLHNMEIKQKVGKLIKEMYVGNGSFQNNPKLGIRYMSDAGYTKAILRHAQLQANYTDVYVYKFSYDGILCGKNFAGLGVDNVTHGCEKNYLFKDRNLMKNLGNIPKNDFLTSKRILTLWTNFVKYLNPTPEKTDELDNLIWPKLSSTDVENIIFLNINDTLKVEKNPRTTFKHWVDIYNKYGVPPFTTY